MSKDASEADIIFNRTNVALAKSRRLIASWLPPRTEEELQNAKPAEDIEKEEDEIFIPTPDLLGLGAKLPQDGDVKRQELSSNDKLRRQLLGKDMAKLYSKSGRGGKLGPGVMPLGSKPRPAPTKKVEEEDDDEEGRSSLGKSKRRKQVQNQKPVAQEDQAEALGSAEPTVSENARRSKKVSTNYLDEVLAEQQRKKQKKKRKREKDA